MGFTKITAEDTANKGVVGLPDTPNLSTQAMQEKFDELATDVIIPKFNNLIDELDDLDITESLGEKISSDDITNIRKQIRRHFHQRNHSKNYNKNYSDQNRVRLFNTELS